MENELISVIIPVYNIEPYIEECLVSVLDQTYRNIEIIVVNDGSTDNSEKIIRKWSEKDSRIRLINQKNSGVSVARNTALDIMKGDYVTFVDGDDWLTKDSIEKMYEQIKRTGVEIVKCGACFINKETGKKRLYSSSQRILNQIEALKDFFSGKGISSSVCGGLYESSLFQDNNIRFSPDVKIGEDAQMTIQLFSKCKKVAIISHIGYLIRVRGQSASRSNVLISQEFSILDSVDLPKAIEDCYKEAYLLRGMTSLLLKNAFNYSKQEYTLVYEQLDYKHINTGKARSALTTKWRLIANVCRIKFLPFYITKFISSLGFRPEF